MVNVPPLSSVKRNVRLGGCVRSSGVESQAGVTKPAAVAREVSVRKRSVHLIKKGGPGGVAVGRHQKRGGDERRCHAQQQH